MDPNFLQSLFINGPLTYMKECDSFYKLLPLFYYRGNRYLYFFFINVSISKNSMDMWKRERKGLLPLPPLGPRHHFYRKKLKFLKIFFILYHIQFFRFLLNWNLKRKDVHSVVLFYRKSPPDKKNFMMNLYDQSYINTRIRYL